MEIVIAGTRYRIDHMPPEWVGFPIRAWFWNDGIGEWDEVLNFSRLHQLASVARSAACEEMEK